MKQLWKFSCDRCTLAIRLLNETFISNTWHACQHALHTQNYLTHCFLQPSYAHNTKQSWQNGTRFERVVVSLPSCMYMHWTVSYICVQHILLPTHITTNMHKLYSVTDHIPHPFTNITCIYSSSCTSYPWLTYTFCPFCSMCAFLLPMHAHSVPLYIGGIFKYIGKSITDIDFVIFSDNWYVFM